MGQRAGLTVRVGPMGDDRHSEWWLLRFRFLFRTPDEQAALQETARLFADYFDDIDVTPSDLAGLCHCSLPASRTH